jgi:hypothetical protein
MNLASIHLGASIVNASSELPGAEASHLLDDDLSRIWLSEDGIPQWLCISLEQSIPLLSHQDISSPRSNSLQNENEHQYHEIRSIGWYCWHSYPSNPKTVRLHVSRDSIKFRTWDTFSVSSMKAGIQLFCCEPINIELYPFIALEIIANFGGSQTYMNQIYLYTEEIAHTANNSFSQHSMSSSMNASESHSVLLDDDTHVRRNHRPQRRRHKQQYQRSGIPMSNKATSQLRDSFSVGGESLLSSVRSSHTSQIVSDWDKNNTNFNTNNHNNNVSMIPVVSDNPPFDDYDTLSDDSLSTASRPVRIDNESPLLLSNNLDPDMIVGRSPKRVLQASDDRNQEAQRAVSQLEEVLGLNHDGDEVRDIIRTTTFSSSGSTKENRQEVTQTEETAIFPDLLLDNSADEHKRSPSLWMKAISDTVTKQARPGVVENENVTATSQSQRVSTTKTLFSSTGFPLSVARFDELKSNKNRYADDHSIGRSPPENNYVDQNGGDSQVSHKSLLSTKSLSLSVDKKDVALSPLRALTSSNLHTGESLFGDRNSTFLTRLPDEFRGSVTEKQGHSYYSPVHSTEEQQLTPPQVRSSPRVVDDQDPVIHQRLTQLEEKFDSAFKQLQSQLLSASINNSVNITGTSTLSPMTSTTNQTTTNMQATPAAQSVTDRKSVEPQTLMSSQSVKSASFSEKSKRALAQIVRIKEELEASDQSDEEEEISKGKFHQQLDRRRVHCIDEERTQTPNIELRNKKLFVSALSSSIPVSSTFSPWKDNIEERPLIRTQQQNHWTQPELRSKQTERVLDEILSDLRAKARLSVMEKSPKAFATPLRFENRTSHDIQSSSLGKDTSQSPQPPPLASHHNNCSALHNVQCEQDIDSLVHDLQQIVLLKTVKEAQLRIVQQSRNS